MRILKSLQKINELSKIESDVEIRELQRRQELMSRLLKSKNNNIKLFSLKVKDIN